jgi:hypothetical protein
MSLTPVTLRNAVDIWVTQKRLTANMPNTIRLRVQTATNQNKYSFVYFARPFPLGAVVVSATLKLYADTPGGTNWPALSRTVTLKRVLGSWKVGRITYNNAPGVTTSGQVAVTKTAAISDGTEWAFDVTSHMQLVSDGAAWYGWRLEINESTERKFYSANAGRLKPVLEVVWSDQPEAPSTLSPSGGRAVSSNKPVLRFDFTDTVGNTSLQAVQVQVNGSNVWTAPSFDSGTVLTSEPQLDLAATAYAGLADGGTAWWRVRVQDAAGVWSDWSDGVSFTRATKGTLAINNPAASPNNFVQEATPPITWTLTGRTQTAFQVVIKDSAGEWLHSSGRQTSAVTSYTLPAKIIHDGLTYTVAVRVWDTFSRESVPNDPPYTETSRSFTYNLSAGVSPVTGFSSTDLAPEPGVQLDWTSSTAPDSFTVVRDGRVIAAAVAPGDVFVSGTQYRVIDRSADPRRSHTWQVRRVVNGVTSTSNPTSTRTLTPIGIWLLDEESNLRQQIMGDDPGDWAMGEQADNHEVRGSSFVVRITQSLRGFEGTISGTIAASTGQTIDQAEANMWEFKRKPGRVYRLVLSNMAIPVVIGNVVVAPSPEQEIIKRVSFDFWQADDLPFTPVL